MCRYVQQAYRTSLTMCHESTMPHRRSGPGDCAVLPRRLLLRGRCLAPGRCSRCAYPAPFHLLNSRLLFKSSSACLVALPTYSPSKVNEPPDNFVRQMSDLDHQAVHEALTWRAQTNMCSHTAALGWRTLEEERVCTECAWEARVAERSAEGPHGTKAASSEASASLGALVGTDASLRAASVTLMYLRGQPSRLCLLQEQEMLYRGHQ